MKILTIIFLLLVNSSFYAQRFIDSTTLTILRTLHSEELTKNNETTTIRPLTRKQAKKISLNYLKLRLGKFNTFKGRPFSSAYINDCWIFESYFNSSRRKRKGIKGGGYYIIINNRNGKVESLIICK